MAANSKELSIYYQNTRGLRTKLPEFHYASTTNNFNIITLTETWLIDEIEDSQLFNENYTVHRRDRNRELTGLSMGGGCLVAINRLISNTRIPEWENECPFENVWISVNKNKSNSKIYINTVYIPPNSNLSAHDDYFDHITQKVNTAPPDSLFIILGDFNMSSITWFNMGNYCEAFDFSGNIASGLINMINLTNMTQRNSVSNAQGRILDLLLSNIPTINVKRCAFPFVKEDQYHPSLEILVELSDVKFLKSIKNDKYNFFKGDYDSISMDLLEFGHSNSTPPTLMKMYLLFTAFYVILSTNTFLFTPIAHRIIRNGTLTKLLSI